MPQWSPLFDSHFAGKSISTSLSLETGTASINSNWQFDMDRATFFPQHSKHGKLSRCVCVHPGCHVPFPTLGAQLRTAATNSSTWTIDITNRQHRAATVQGC
jgi:hypothetical protein